MTITLHTHHTIASSLFLAVNCKHTRNIPNLSTHTQMATKTQIISAEVGNSTSKFSDIIDVTCSSWLQLCKIGNIFELDYSTQRS